MPECGTCEPFVSGMAYDGNDFLPPGAPCPEWWAALDAGDCTASPASHPQPALIFDSKEACCTFCLEHNRRGLQPPCTHASFGPSSSEQAPLCYAKSGTPPKMQAHKARDSFLAGEPCPTYQPREHFSWGDACLLALAFAFMVYAAGGTRFGVRRHPHQHRWRELWALVVDGCSFARGTGGDNSDSDRSADGGQKTESLRATLLPAPAEAAVVRTQATRGATTALHQVGTINFSV